MIIDFVIPSKGESLLTASPVGDRHVKAVVAAHLLVSPAPPTVVSSEEGFSLAWNHKVYDHSSPPCQSGFSPDEEVVHSNHPHEGHLAVRVRVNATRDDQLPCCIDHPH